MIDWVTHFTELRRQLVGMINAARDLDSVPQVQRQLVEMGMARVLSVDIGGRLGSRHIPTWAKALHPGLQWDAIANYRRRQKSDGFTAEFSDQGGKLAVAFARHHALAVADSSLLLEQKLIAMKADQDIGRSFLALETNGRVAEVTVRVPFHRLGQVEALVEAAYADVAPPSIEVVRNLLIHASGELEAAGVRRLLLFGSTARGDAKPWSDVDLAYELDEPAQDPWQTWWSIQQTLERALDRRVDLHDLSEIKLFAAPVEVWRSDLR